MVSAAQGFKMAAGTEGRRIRDQRRRGFHFGLDTKVKLRTPLNSAVPDLNTTSESLATSPSTSALKPPG